MSLDAPEIERRQQLLLGAYQVTLFYKSDRLARDIRRKAETLFDHVAVSPQSSDWDYLDAARCGDRPLICHGRYKPSTLDTLDIKLEVPRDMDLRINTMGRSGTLRIIDYKIRGNDTPSVSFDFSVRIQGISGLREARIQGYRNSRFR